MLAAGPLNGPAGSPVVVVADAAGLIEFEPNSRRVNANADHSSESAAGASPLLPPSSQLSRPRPTPLTEPEADAGRAAAVITGASAAVPAAATSTTAATGDESPAGTSGCDTGADSGTADESDKRDNDGVVTVLPDMVAGASRSAGAALSERLRCEPGSEVPTDPEEASEPRPPRTTDGELPPVGGEESLPDATEGALSEESAADEPPRTLVRVLVRVSDRVEEPESLDADEPAPVDPPVPVVSAKAAGIDATAEPAPRAIANAPTRPTKRANPAAEA